MNSENYCPEIMAILNVTNDSFYSSSRVTDVSVALKKVEEFKQAGADWLDIGAESTRPNATPISWEEELERLSPIFNAIKNNIDIKISVDTRHTQTMKYVIDQGASMINDTHSLSAKNSVETIANSDVLVTLMHMQNTPKNMQDNPKYNNIIEDLVCFLKNKINLCTNHNIKQNRIIIDPGFGFGKNLQHNWDLLKGLDKLKCLNSKILIGISRKSFIGKTLGINNPEHRGVASAIIHSFACLKGVDIIRTHDVLWTKQAIELTKHFMAEKT
jgi:dihydropteroate synthase